MTHEQITKAVAAAVTVLGDGFTGLTAFKIDGVLIGMRLDVGNCAHGWSVKLPESEFAKGRRHVVGVAVMLGHRCRDSHARCSEL